MRPELIARAADVPCGIFYGRAMTESMARRLFQLVEPIAVVTYMANEPTEAVMALGLGNMWDAYFAGRAAPLGCDVTT